MSRLFSPPLFNPTFSNPFAPQRVTNPLLPSLDPEYEQSYLSSAAENSLGGLAYLGKLADKTFGGRAVRGLLGGRPNELLSIIPLSDTTGLTDPRDTVWGRDLLSRSGIVGADDPTSFGWDDAAGIGAEIALDPATYLGFGPLTRAGLLAQKTAALGPDLASTASRIGGYGVRESDLLKIAPDLTEAKRVVGLPHETSVLPVGLETRAKWDRVPIDPRYSLDFAPTNPNLMGPSLPKYLGKTEQTATPLAGALGVGLPFTARAPLLTGDAGAQVAKYLPYAVTGIPKALDAGVDYATGFSPLRAASALFEPAVKGMYAAPTQDLARTFIGPNEAGHKYAAMDSFAKRFLDLKPYLQRGTEAATLAMRLGREAAEQVTRISLADLTAAGRHFSPQEISHIRQIGAGMGEHLRSGQVIGAERRLATDAPELLDDAIDYFTRRKVVIPREAGESIFSYATRYIREYGARHQSQIARDPIFKGIPGGTNQINEWVRDPLLSGPAGMAKTNPLLTRQYLVNEMTGGAQAAGKYVAPEVAQQAARLTDWLGNLSPTYSKKGIGFFSDDMPADYLTRLNRSAVAQSAAESTYEGITRLATPMNRLTDTHLVPLDEVLKSAALTGKDASGMPIAYSILAKKLGVSPNDIANMGVPRDVATDMQRLNQAWINPGEMLPILAAWDGVSNLFKTFLTAPFVSFHTRNALSALFNMWRGDAFSSKAMSEAWNVTRGLGLKERLPGMRGATPEEWSRELMEELIGTQTAYVPRPTNTSDIVGSGGEVVVRQPNLPHATGNSPLADAWAGVKNAVPKNWEELNPLNVQGVNRAEDTNSVIKGFRAAGQHIEDWTRVSHYIAKRQQGFNPMAAAMETKKYQLDYSYLTNFEKQVMKRVMPWFSFSRRNLPPLLEDLAKNPSKITATLRGVTRGRTPYEYIPEHVAEGTSIPIPGAEEGSQRYIRSFGLPFEDELIKTLGSVAQGDITRGAQQILGMSQPMVRAPLEFTFGTQLYSGRPLTDLRPSATIDAVVKALGGDVRDSRIATEAVSATPLSRFFTTSDRVIDDRKPAWQRAVNIGSGVQFGDAEIAQQRDASYKRLLDELLTGRPGVRQQQGVYLNKPMLAEGAIDPTTLMLYRMYLDTDRRIRDMPK